MAKDRILSFIIDIFLVKLIIFTIGSFVSIPITLEDIIFLIIYSNYYIFSNIIFKKTLGKRFLYLVSESKRKKEERKKWFIIDIILKYLFIVPVIIIFTDFQIIIEWTPQKHKGITATIPLIYLIYLGITGKFLHDKFTKIRVVSER